METIDRVDPDLRSHIETFLAELPQRIQLERIMSLSCDDPATTVELLKEIQAVVHRERLKAIALYALAQGEVGEQYMC